MAPEVTSSAAPAIPSHDRRGSDVPLMLPIPVTTCSRDRRFKSLYNGTAAASPAGKGVLQGGEVELGHGQHDLRYPGDPVGVRVADHVEERARDDLPAQAVPVLDPAAGDLVAAVAQAVPVVVHLGLVRARDHDRDGLVERELRAAVEGGELLPVELELHQQHRADRTGAS